MTTPTPTVLQVVTYGGAAPGSLPISGAMPNGGVSSKAGDLIVFTVGADAQGFDVPAGFTALILPGYTTVLNTEYVNPQDAGPGTGATYIQIFYRVTDGTESTTVTFTGKATTPAAVGHYITGVDPSEPFFFQPALSENNGLVDTAGSWASPGETILSATLGTAGPNDIGFYVVASMWGNVAYSAPLGYNSALGYHGNSTLTEVDVALASGALWGALAAGPGPVTGMSVTNTGTSNQADTGSIFICSAALILRGTTSSTSGWAVGHIRWSGSWAA